MRIRRDRVNGYNPTFDLWSTADLTTGNDSDQVDQKLVGATAGRAITGVCLQTPYSLRGWLSLAFGRAHHDFDAAIGALLFD